MTKIIDTNVDVTTRLAALKAAGVTTIIRYLDPIGPGNPKCIKPAEARAIAAAGLRLALVCEGWGDFAHGGISAGAGERDGDWCAKYAPTVGAPRHACIYFAVDTDANAAQIGKLVLPYFKAVHAACAGAGFRNGCYGSGDVCAAVTAGALAELSWLSCSIGWSGSRDYLAANKWALRQHLPARVAGIDCDANDMNLQVNSGDFGDFVPFAEAA